MQEIHLSPSGLPLLRYFFTFLISGDLPYEQQNKSRWENL